MARKLHELIAVEPDLKGTAEKILIEAVGTFSKRENLFLGSSRRYVPLFENEPKQPDENKAITETVIDKLRYVFGIAAKAVDALASKEVTNLTALASVEMNSKVVWNSLPAVVLINFENYFKRIRDALEHIPTLDPGEDWKWDEKSNHFVTDEKQAFRTKKVLKALVKYEATKEHPAQVETYSEDIPVGVWHGRKFSAMLSPKQKSDMLSRVDELIRAFKEARQRANNVEVSEIRIADLLFSYILGEKK